MIEYDNPVIPGFFPDPSVCRVGDRFFLVNSTFTYFPAVPIFTSRNLVDWTQMGNVLDRPGQVDLSVTANWMSAGVWAPTIRHHDGKFWMITTNVTDNGARNFFVTADDGAGPWSDPTPIDIDGIDPDLAWDDDGNCWVHFSRFVDVARCRIDDMTGDVLDAPTPTWSGTGGVAPEAPHLFRRGGYWYLIVAEGGTGPGHAVSIARGPSPTGPWQGCFANPILTHRGTGHPVQNTGHADLVEAPDGSWWLVFLGVRRSGGVHVIGRETFLAPVDWIDDWPVVGPVELAGAADLPAPRDPVIDAPRNDFDAPLGAEWVGLRTSPAEMSSVSERPGWLVVRDGGFVARRQQHHRCRVRTLVEVTSGEAGLRVLMDESHHVDVSVRDGQVVASGHIGEYSARAETPAPQEHVTLVIEIEPGGHADRIRLGHEGPNGEARILLDLDGRYLSTEVTGGFVGRTIGMFATGGDAAFDWFEYEAT